MGIVQRLVIFWTSEHPSTVTERYRSDVRDKLDSKNIASIEASDQQLVERDSHLTGFSVPMVIKPT